MTRVPSAFVMTFFLVLSTILPLHGLASPRPMFDRQRAGVMESASQSPSSSTVQERPSAAQRLPSEYVSQQRQNMQEQQWAHKTYHNTPKHWELRLYNDETNYEFWVAAQLVKIAGLTEREAFDAMKTADAIGQATIRRYECMEMAEHYHQALQDEGLSVKLHPIPVVA